MIQYKYKFNSQVKFFDDKLESDIKTLLDIYKIVNKQMNKDNILLQIEMNENSICNDVIRIHENILVNVKDINEKTIEVEDEYVNTILFQLLCILKHHLKELFHFDGTVLHCENIVETKPNNFEFIGTCKDSIVLLKNIFGYKFKIMRENDFQGGKYKLYPIEMINNFYMYNWDDINVNSIISELDETQLCLFAKRNPRVYFKTVKNDLQKYFLLSKVDYDYCINQQNFYLELYNFYKEHQIFISKNKINNEFFSSDTIKKSVDNTYKAKQIQFIKNIVDYFNDKYGISVSSDNIISSVKKEEYTPISYKDIIYNILESIGWISFKDRLHEVIKQSFHVNETKKITIDCNSVIIHNYVSFDFMDKVNEYALNSEEYEKMKNLFKTLNYFEEGIFGLENDSLKDIIYSGFKLYKKEVYTFRTYPCNTEKIKELEIMKGGSIKITFNSDLLASNFYNEYDIR